MPSHTIGDAHERCNGVVTVLVWYPAKKQIRERAFLNTAGKEDPVELDFRLNLISC